MRVDIPKDNPNMTCQAVPLQSQSMVSNQQDHDPPSRPDATPVLSHRPPSVANSSAHHITDDHVLQQTPCRKTQTTAAAAQHMPANSRKPAVMHRRAESHP
ncbi:unnamed protein product [Pleuronectes platessa]|uniref:Uncharacterized protein n=1 Tax=Pleuronectes platessa TaxID=8262 RepID=A0A9N7UHI7_PLEPL|nr:unnamed protein product [Pleuronectes platessa]